MNNEIECSGHLQVRKIFDDGSEDVVYDDHNQITRGFLIALTRMFSMVPALAPDTSVSDTDADGKWYRWGLHSVWFTSGASTSPTKDDFKPEGSVEYYHTLDKNNEVSLESSQLAPDTVDGIIELDLAIPKSEANGVDISGFNVFTRGSKEDPSNYSPGNWTQNERYESDTATLAARQLITPISKTSDFRIGVKWRLQFTIN